MNTVEKFSLEAALKIQKPFVHEAYYPLAVDNYITFNICESHSSRKWDFFQECINILTPYLSKKNINIVQLGEKGDPMLQGVHNLVGSTSPTQCAYIIKNSLLHFGATSFLSYFSSFYNKPTVTLYADIDPLTDCPLWSPDSLQKNLLPVLEGKPSYAREENPKTINTIYPEHVAMEVLDFLKISHDLSLLTPFHIGEKYASPCFEIIPDFIPDPNFLPRVLLNVRMDYHYNEDNLIPLANNRKLSIVMDKPIDLSKLNFIKNNLNHFFYFVSSETDPKYLQDLRKIGHPVTLLHKNPDTIADMRLKFLDMIVEEVQVKTLEKFDKKDKVDDSTYYKSAKALFSKGVEYSCKAAWKQGIKAKKEQKIINCPEFWEEIDHFKLYNKNG